MSPSSETPSPNLHARLRDVADAVRASNAVAVPKQSILTLEWGVVTNVNDTPPTVDVAPSNNTATSPPSLWSQVSFQSWYQPAVGDNVLVLIDGRDKIVFGTMAVAGGGLQSVLAYAFDGPVANKTFAGPYVPGGNTWVVGAKGDMGSGSITMKVQVDGTDVTGLTGLSVTTSPTAWTCTPYRIPNLKKVNGVSSAGSGAADMSFSVFTATV